MYYSDKVTDEKLEKLEKRIKDMYQRAYLEMKAQAEEYFAKFEDRYNVEYEAFLRGEYTDTEFKAWVRTQIARGKGYEKFRDELAQRMTDANKVASAYINDATPSVYSLNRDYEAYRIEQNYNIDFHLTDEMTVRRLAGNDNHIEFKTTSVNSRKDYNWNRQQIHNALIAGILQGKSINKLADSYYQVMGRNRSSAMRNARTSFTSAQNAGRVETYYRATEMGISLTKEWLANFDDHVRASHEALNGQRVAHDKPFSNGLMYPADPNGAPAEVYNCRCTLRAVLPKINDEDLSKKYIEEKTNDENRYDTNGYRNIYVLNKEKITPQMESILNENDLDNRMKKINNLVGEYIGRESNWNGITTVNPKLRQRGYFNTRTKTICVREKDNIKTEIHEIIHGYCIYDKKTNIFQSKAIKIEEKAVELLTQEICEENGLHIRQTKKDIDELKELANKKGMSYIEISLEIINTPNSKMPDKLEEIKRR